MLPYTPNPNEQVHMTKVKNPFLSFAAAGKVGDHLAIRNWKGIPVAQPPRHPTNPRSPAQTSHRAAWRLAVAFWHYLHVHEGVVPAWKLAATWTPGRRSGFNLFLRNAVRAYKADPDNPMALNFHSQADHHNRLFFRKLNKEGADITGVPIEQWAGDNPRRLIHQFKRDGSGAWCHFPSFPRQTGPYYMTQVLAGYHRTGIHRITFAAPAPNQLENGDFAAGGASWNFAPFIWTFADNQATCTLADNHITQADVTTLAGPTYGYIDIAAIQDARVHFKLGNTELTYDAPGQYDAYFDAEGNITADVWFTSLGPADSITLNEVYFYNA